MEIINTKVGEFIIPRKLIFKNELFKITKISKKFEIKGYVVKTVNGKIDMVILSCPHPNAYPRTGEFCIPHGLRKHNFAENSNKMIISMLSCFNLDDCYFAPWDEIEYEKQEVLGAWSIKN